MGDDHRPEVLAAIPSAFDASGKLDADGCRALVRHLAAGGVDGYFVAGTAGEFPALARDERRRIAEITLEEAGPGQRVFLHVGAASAHQALAMLDDARRLGVPDVAVITPYFLTADPAAVTSYYRAVCDAAEGLRVYPYLYEAVSGNRVDVELLAELAALPHMAGAKISGEPPERVGDYIAALPPGFVVYAGADQELVAMFEHGARGVISAMSSCLPRPFTGLAAALGRDDHQAVERLQAQVDDVCDVLRGNPARIKAGLRMQGVEIGSPRMAVPEPDAAALAEIRRIVEAYG